MDIFFGMFGVYVNICFFQALQLKQGVQNITFVACYQMIPTHLELGPKEINFWQTAFVES